MSAAQPSGRSAPSWAPIWIGLVVGLLVGALFGHGTFLLTALIGAVIGVAVRVSGAARTEQKGRELEQLESRVAKLEREVATLRAQAPSAQAPLKPQPPAPAVAAELLRPPAPAGIPEPQWQPTQPIQAAAPAPTPTPIVPSGAPPSEAAFPPTQPVFPRAAEVAPEIDPVGRFGTAARDWLLGGNTVARVGLLILFVGIAFLLRYVAEHTHVPIEARLAGVAALGVVFLAVGWRLRTRQPGFAMTLQGGAIGILYLTAFASLRVFGVLPQAAAFVFMALLAVLSGILAILQDGRALAVLGALGGFAAPLLVSTGAGHIEVLFAFYLLLDLGVLGVAWFRAWRELNWIAFVFTFGVSGLWSVQHYSADDFAIGQGFLLAFWLLFLSVALISALRQPTERRGRFDTTLVFALPLAVFGIETRFTHGLEFAFAALAGSAVYLAVSAMLLRRREAALRLLIEANFGLGLALLTLAVPLAASAEWTAAAWALEGIATAWIGLRQRRALPLLAGIALQALAAASLAKAVITGQASLAAEWSGVTLNLAVLAGAALVVAALLHSRIAEDWDSPAGLPRVWMAWTMRLIGWGWAGVLLWQPLEYPGYVYAWCALALALAAADRRSQPSEDSIAGGAIAEVSILGAEWVASSAWVIAALAAALAATPPHLEHPASVLFVRLCAAAVALAASLLSLGRDPTRRTAAGVLLTLSVFAWLFAVLAQAVVRDDPPHAVAQLGLLLAALTALVLGWLAAQLRWGWPQRLAWAFHCAHLVFAAFVVWNAVESNRAPSMFNGAIAWVFAWLVYYARFAQAARSGEQIPRDAVAALHVAGLWALAAMVAAECTVQLRAVAGSGWVEAVWGACAAAALWFASMRPPRWPASAAPHAYTGIGAASLAVFAGIWLLASPVLSDGDPAPLPPLPVLNPLDIASLLVLAALAQWRSVGPLGRYRQLADAVLPACAFWIANLILLHGLHFAAGVGWSIGAWKQSLLVQAGFSILWTVFAMIAMLLAHRRALRPLWVAGAVLLGGVVIKLFLVDLSGRGTVERIVSFVAVGLLIMLIGYLTPVPPVRAATPGGGRELETGS